MSKGRQGGVYWHSLSKDPIANPLASGFWSSQQCRLMSCIFSLPLFLKSFMCTLAQMVAQKQMSPFVIVLNLHFLPIEDLGPLPLQFLTKVQ